MADAYSSVAQSVIIVKPRNKSQIVNVILAYLVNKHARVVLIGNAVYLCAEVTVRIQLFRCLCTMSAQITTPLSIGGEVLKFSAIGPVVICFCVALNCFCCL